METSAGQRAFRDHLERDAPARELSVSRFVAMVSGLLTVVTVGLGPAIGWSHALRIAALLAAVTAYHGLLVWAINRGWFRSVMSWGSMAIEVSIPTGIFWLDLQRHGAEYALSSPPVIGSAVLVALSGLRANRALAIAAGVLATAELLLSYLLWAAPRLPPEAMATYGLPLVGVRGILLLAMGVLMAVFVTHFQRRSEEAFTAARERDFFGKYLLHERIGAGGMAEVFRATYCPEGGFEKQVAVKRILPSLSADTEFLDSFRAEAELGSRLNHPNIVQVLDFGRHADAYFLAMEFIEGAPLRRVLDVYNGVGLPEAAVAYLARELCAALEYVHRRTDDEGRPLKLVHRDINPPNVLISTQGEVKLTDFGVARVAHRALTRAGEVKGKWAYFAPEQAAGNTIDGRVDLFALGITLYETLTGRYLFPDGDDDASRAAVYQMPIPPLRSVRPDVSRELESVVMRLLERDLSRRMPSAGEALAQLTPFGPRFLEGHRQLCGAVVRTKREWPLLLEAARAKRRQAATA